MARPRKIPLDDRYDEETLLVRQEEKLEMAFDASEQDRTLDLSEEERNDRFARLNDEDMFQDVEE